MKRIISIALLILITMFSSCKNDVNNAEPTTLSVNTMTENEKEKSSVKNLSILDREPATTAVYENFVSINARSKEELKSVLDKMNFKEYFESEKPFPEFDTYDAWVDSFWASFDGNTNVGINLPIETANLDWEFDRTEIESIKDSTREILIYDEELDLTFVVMLTLPPDFDKSKAYPSLVMTDGVWNFGNEHYALYQKMKDGEIQDTMLVSIGYDYAVNGADDTVRYGLFIEQQEKFLNFITDNLMPYIAENYLVDFSNSSFYGASLGGVFSHYALFNSDKYENQPFKRYVISSPVLWRYGKDVYTNDFDYFERNKTLDKEVYITVGDDEDNEFISIYGEDVFGEFDSTIKGAQALSERLKEHNANVTYEVFAGYGHSNYSEKMFEKFMLKFYAE